MPTPLGGGHYHHQHQDRLDRSTDLGFLDTHHEEGEAHYRAIILPPLTLAEALKTTRIHSVAGLTGDRTALVTPRPCRAPHHTISDVGLITGGHLPMPGEVTLAHNGVLFLDELPEFAAMSSRCCANRLRRVSYMYNFAGVLDLSTFIGLAISVMAMRDSGSAR